MDEPSRTNGLGNSMGPVIDGKTCPHLYLRRVQLSRGKAAYLVKKNGAYAPVSWDEVHSHVLGLFRFFREQKFEAGEKIIIMSQTRSEWAITDIAAQCAGLVTVPIYPSLVAEDCAYIVDHCDARLIFAEDEKQLRKLLDVFGRTREPLPVVTFEEPSTAIEGLTVFSYSELVKSPRDETLNEEFGRSAASIQPSDVFSIVYTSGTTGQPKGAVLTQSNMVSELRATINDLDLSEADLTLTFLPFAHILGRVESLAPLISGATLAFAECNDSVAENAQEVGPTILVSVPRVYEKAFARIQAMVDSGSPLKKKLFTWALGVGREVARARSNRQPLSPLQSLKYQVADRLIFAKVRAKMGGRVRWTVSGGAPLSPDLCEFFHACGVTVLEGYGLTETTAAMCFNRPDDFTFGTVGRPIAGVDLKIDMDGEILVRGTTIFREYYKNPQATREAFTKDGWFRTGDIGEIDGRGNLKITDRKKEIIVTAAGKNIAPQKIENLIKTIRFISNVMVYGDRQRYLVALLTLNEHEISSWARHRGISFSDVNELMACRNVMDLLESEMSQVNGRLASFETVKRFKVLSKDFTIEDGELTPSLKVKRRVVTQRHQGLLNEMYL